jgi:transposase
MLSFHAHLKVFVATAPCDLRASFNGLWNAAQTQLGEDPRSGALFVFGNRRKNRIKILYFDGTGVSVRVGGHVLNPGVVNRLIELTTPPCKIRITWP